MARRHQLVMTNELTGASQQKCKPGFASVEKPIKLTVME